MRNAIWTSSLKNSYAGTGVLRPAIWHFAVLVNNEGIIGMKRPAIWCFVIKRIGFQDRYTALRDTTQRVRSPLNGSPCALRC